MNADFICNYLYPRDIPEIKYCSDETDIRAVVGMGPVFRPDAASGSPVESGLC
jgi:hypothetical protein